MSKRIGPIIVIAPEDDDICEFCGNLDELRPYGPNRERICYDCAMKDEATTERIMGRDLFDDPETH
jgi:hypothetical protein